jgi:hypothetical protein
LERALAAPVTGRERPWAARLGSAVGALARVLRAHAQELESPDGLWTEVDLTRPSLVRQLGHLRREQADLLGLASRLQEELDSAARAFACPAAPGEPADLPPGPRAGDIPDFGQLRRQAEELLQAVRRQQGEEASLVLESVTTDIGVGD